MGRRIVLVHLGDISRSPGSQLELDLGGTGNIKVLQLQCILVLVSYLVITDCYASCIFSTEISKIGEIKSVFCS